MPKQFSKSLVLRRLCFVLNMETLTQHLIVLRRVFVLVVLIEVMHPCQVASMANA